MTFDILWTGFVIIFAWSMLGIYALMRFSDSSEFLTNANITDIVNPVHIYKHIKVNWFGCFLLTLVLNLVSPFLTIFCWTCKLCQLICKLCTVGRQK